MLRTFAKPLSTRLHKPLLDAIRVCRTSTSFHEAKAANCSYQTFTGLHMFLTPLAETLLACASLWRKLTVPTTCFTSFCRALTAFVQPVSAFTSLCGMLSGFAKPLPDLTSLCMTLIAFVELLQPFTRLRAANCSYHPSKAHRGW